MFHKLFTFDDLKDLKEIYFEVNHENVSAVSGIIFNSLNRIVIEEKVIKLYDIVASYRILI